MDEDQIEAVAPEGADATGGSAQGAGEQAVANGSDAEAVEQAPPVLNEDGTVTIGGRTFALTEVDEPAPAAQFQNPKDCPDCGTTYEAHEIVLGKCQPCNSKAQAAKESMGEALLKGISKLIHGGDPEAAAE